MKKITLEKIYIFIIISFFSGITTASEAETSEVSPSQQELLIKKIKELEEQNTILRANLETTEQFSKTNLATTHWALGTVATLAILLIGFSWFNNNTTLKKEKELLEKETKNQINESISKISKSIKNKLKEEKEHLEEHVKEKINQEIRILERKNRQFTENLTLEINELKLEETKRETEKWIGQGIYINALRSALKALELAIATDFILYIENEIDNVTKILKQVEDSNKKINISDISDFSEKVNKLPQKYSDARTVLINKINDLAA